MTGKPIYYLSICHYCGFASEKEMQCAPYFCFLIPNNITFAESSSGQESEIPEFPWNLAYNVLNTTANADYWQ